MSNPAHSIAPMCQPSGGSVYVRNPAPLVVKSNVPSFRLSMSGNQFLKFEAQFSIHQAAPTYQEPSSFSCETQCAIHQCAPTSKSSFYSFETMCLPSSCSDYIRNPAPLVLKPNVSSIRLHRLRWLTVIIIKNYDQYLPLFIIL
ncbi:hypothetical protein CEXT_800561 [Caerostris extrusa]|uniref:Uncharacterized protein n=1 Tax=Caerostris extrusa TaxID=172846 RepID=A0AAV4XUE2_CAEEX|nr:hypothetical protein CEXT_800561 [Caerostris extrusa]